MIRIDVPPKGKPLILAVAKTSSGMTAMAMRNSDPGSVSRLRVFHLNDSAKPHGSRVDRHAHIGQVTNAPETYLVDGRQHVLVAAGDTLYAFTVNP